ncbi:hypothetical protein ACWERY_15015 [Streptomyces sp. NPDC004082]|uniref:hypothetical protein n=1 Tax=unclassified Streptomyces TaxID=2593676 RepID=UPI0033A98112
MRMRTIVTAAVLSAACVLGGSAQAMANDWGGDNDGRHVSGCGILAGTTAGSGEANTYYAEGCLNVDDDDEGRDWGHDGRDWGHDDEGRGEGHDGRDEGHAGMQDPLHLGGVQG